MAQQPQIAEIQKSGNGRNGSGTRPPYGGPIPPPSPEPEPVTTNETRRMIATLIMAGSLTDAQALYFALPGSTSIGWSHLERTLEPARRYVVDGDPVWTHTVIVTDYDPVMTPQGDCAEDTRPVEERNPARQAEKKKLGRNGNE